ncbi:MAG: insulinase family protein [Gemmatimonas sp.]
MPQPLLAQETRDDHIAAAPIPETRETPVLQLTRLVVSVAVGAALIAATGTAQTGTPSPPLPPFTQKLTVSPDVKIGVLPNGIKYYIRKNSLPAKRAELRLAINAGSILEDDNQRGYAHFIEHTAFNGTTHFKKNDLIKYLQSIGVRFGADLNAYTSFDETVYQLSVPTDTARIVETAFSILQDWAHGQVFDSTEVVGERGVVNEERRSGLGAEERMSQAAIPILLKGSKYGTRLPIGTEASILAAQPSGLRKFYNDWYRPDLMAVVAVGDFDVATIEALIKKDFGTIPAATNPRPRVNATVPNNVAPLVAIESDAEATSSDIFLAYKRPNKPVATVGDFRTAIIERLYFGILGARLNEIAQKPDAPFLGAGVGGGSFVARDVQAFTLNASVKDGGILNGIEAVLAEAKRVDQFGFLNSELQRAKDNMLRSYERSYAERDKTNSAPLVDELVRNFLEQEYIPGITAEYNLAKGLLPGITIAEVNAAAQGRITDENRIVGVTAPRKAGVTLPTEAEVLAVMNTAGKSTLTAYTETLGDEPLLDRVAPPGKIVSTKTTASINLTEWKLSNGARVLVKPTDFKADEVLFSAYSVGGTSLVSDADYQSAAYASSIMSLSGLGKYSAVDLQKKLAGKAAGANASISSTSEGLSGGASPKDLETLFQLAYLRFTAPRLDTTAWQSAKQRSEASLANRNANPLAAFSDTLTATMTQYNSRSRPPSAATLAEINPQKALAFYKDRFANAGDFTFVIVGSVNLDSLKPLVEKYIASLPGTGRVETWKDVGDAPPSGVVEKVVRKGSEPQAQTAMIFHGAFNYNPQTRFEMLALTTLAEMWLTDALREEMGGTYSPGLSGGGAKIPRGEYSISVQYTSSPDNVDKLSARTFRVIDSLKNTLASAADLQKVKEQIGRTRETSLRTNSFWASNIAGRDQNGEDPAGLTAPYEVMLKGLTSKEIQDAAKLYFNLKEYVKVVLLPATTP